MTAPVIGGQLALVVDAPWLPKDHFSENDRRWFSDNPRRRLRLRNFYSASFSGEIGHSPEKPNVAHWVLVVRIEAGIHLRIPLGTGNYLFQTEPASDAEVAGVVAHHAEARIGPLVFALLASK